MVTKKMIAALAAALVGSPALAQVPVFDNAVNQQATKTAANTQQILTSNASILSNVEKTLQAVTGARSDGQPFANAATGGGFNFGQGPQFGSLLGGGQMNFGGIGGNWQQLATTLINGMALVKSLSGGSKAPAGIAGNNQAYLGAVNTVAALSATIGGVSAATQARNSAFQGIATQLGNSPDLKAAVEQNSQIGVQTAQTMNEAVGTINGASAALTSHNANVLAAQSGAAATMAFDPSKASGLVGK